MYNIYGDWMRKKLLILLIFTLFLSFDIKAVNQYDSVILNGDIYNSSSKSFLENYNIGIKNGKIEIITRDTIYGKTTVYATDKLVIPAFIDAFQRNYGDAFEEFRLFDGVTTSIYVTEDDYDTFLLNNSMKISYINRIMIKDITNTYATIDEDTDYTNFKSVVTKSIADGFAGFYIKPDNTDNLQLEIIDKSFPLYIDLENISEKQIIPYLNLLVENGNNKRNIHLIAVNKFYNILDELLIFVENHENITIGGYPFSYISIVPNNENSSFMEPLIDNLAVHKDNKIPFKFSTINFKDNSKYAIIGATNGDTVNTILKSDRFISESYDILPGSIMTTQDANTFMGRLLLSKNNGLIETAIDSQTISIKNVFNSFDSPLLNKGSIEIGADADIIVIDPKKMSPHSSITDIPHKSTGITEIIREGVLIVENEKIKDNIPKARWIKRSVSNFKELENFAISLKGDKSEKINAINYSNNLYIPIKEFSDYLNIIYEESQGVATLGGVIKIEIGSKSFSVGTNKSELDTAIILINNGIYASYDSLKSILDGYYILNQNGDEIKIKKNSKATLLEPPLNDSEINIVLDNKKIIYVYLLSIFILLILIKYLNHHKQKKKKKEVKWKILVY